MADSFVFAAADNGSDLRVSAEKVVKWVHGFDGADAHIVYDYVPVEGPVRGSIPGALNGVTVQWDHDGDGNADSAVHVRPGGTVTRDGDGFAVENPEVVIEELPSVDPELLAAVLKSIRGASK